MFERLSPRCPIPGSLRLRSAGVVLALTLVGCDGDATQLVEELNAAREGCTEEQLKTSDEACVQMFERYAEMGEDAMETYIGGMRAMDEALQRRGGIQFDTAGLARVFSDSLLATSGDTALQPDPLELQYLDEETTFSEPLPSWGDGGATWQRNSSGSFADPGAPEQSAGRPDGRLMRERRPATVPDRRPPAPTRGQLLPPEDRLRRRWIGDEVPPGDYVEDREPRSSRPAPPPDVQDEAWPDRPDEQLSPQRRE